MKTTVVGVWLEEEGYDSFPLFRVVAKLFLVVAVLSFSPHGHLHEPEKCKHNGADILCHDRKRNPRSHFVRVVGARDQVEQIGERIACNKICCTYNNTIESLCSKPAIHKVMFLRL